MRVLVTGATGYIGRHLTRRLARNGHEVVAATRSRVISEVMGWMPFDLREATAIDLPPRVAVVIHLASSAPSGNNDFELLSNRRLLEAAKRRGAKYIFMSSQTARQDAPTQYGRNKWRMEQDVLAEGGIVVRPGQVYGGDERGLFGEIVRLVRRLPFLPAFLPAPNVQPIHVDDLAEGLVVLSEREGVGGVVWRLASSQPVSFTRFLREIGRYRLGKRRCFLPVPTVVIRAIGHLVPKGSRIGGSIERLISLFDLPVMETADDLGRLGFKLRSLRSGLSQSAHGDRRGLIVEGRALLRYVLGERPRSAVIRRYVRAVEEVRDGLPMPLPTLVVAMPTSFALLESNPACTAEIGGELIWRVNAATLLAEATPEGATRFLGGQGRSGWVSAAANVVQALAAELFWRSLRIILRPFLRRIMRDALQAG